MLRDFDALRAEIWRLAGQRDLSERDLIQRLLDTVGPALEVCRACFNEPDDHGMSCTLEWIRQGVKPSVGTRLPRIVENALVRPYPWEFNLDASIDALPAWVRPIGAPLLRAIGAALDVESVLVVPYSMVGGVVDGVLTFDMSFGRGVKTGWSKPLMPVVYELAMIVNQAIARRRAETALSTAQRRHQALVECLGEGVGLLGADEVFAFANPASDQIFGVGKGALVGRCLGEFIDDAAWLKVRDQTAHRAQGECRSFYELQITRPDGVVRTLEVTCTPEVEQDRAGIATVAVFRDVTDHRAAERERRRVELQVQRTQKLESLGVLAGGIAHDYNNVLAGILAHAELALQQLPDAHDARESLDQIRSAAEQSSQFTRQLLTYAGKGVLVSEPLDLSRVVSDITALLRAAISKKAQLVLQLDSSLPLIEAEPGQIRQIVMNLLTNASEAFGDASGQIVITTGSVHLDRATAARAQIGSEVPEGPYVFVEVRDDGCGMSPEAQARMFDPFFTTKFVGRGLGLAAALGIIRAHRGAVFVDSSPGCGTSVRVCFPDSPVRPASLAPPRAPQATPRSAAPQPHPDSGLVLIVDDDRAVLSSMSRLLGRSGYRTLGAADGTEAIEVFRTHATEISIVLLDLAMPGRNGTEVLAELRAMSPRLPVILCSGYSEQEVELRLDDRQCTAFLQKPFAHTDLLREMRRVIGVQADGVSRPGTTR